MSGNTSNFVCQENGLTAGEARTLAYVALYPASRQTALAAQMNIEPVTLVTFLGRLESRGLVRGNQIQPIGAPKSFSLLLTHNRPLTFLGSREKCRKGLCRASIPGG